MIFAPHVAIKGSKHTHTKSRKMRRYENKKWNWIANMKSLFFLFELLLKMHKA